MTDKQDPDRLAAFEAELIRRERHERELDALWRMTPAERAATLLAGDMTRRQLAAWRERHPEQIPPPDQIRRAQEKALWAMSPRERAAAMDAGRLTDYQLFAWSQRRPYEVPLIDGELAWIVYRTADWIEAGERERAEGQLLRCETTGRPLLNCGCSGCEDRRARAVKRMRADGVL